MSLIDQALKKTQSLLRQQNKTEARSESTTQPPIYTAPFTAQKIVNSFKTKKRFIMPEINKYWIIGALSAAILSVLIIEIHAHSKIIAQRYVNFYGNIFSHLSIRKSPSFSDQSLVLDGTMEMGKNRAALINGHLYHTGETIDGLKITQIDYNHIFLKNPNTQQIQILTPKLTQ